jgi:hypothetical protein
VLLNGTSFSGGKVEQAFNFNGIHQLVSVPDAPALNPPAQLTLETWVYVSQFSANDSVAVVGKDDPFSDRQYMLGIATLGGQWNFRAHVGSTGGYHYFNGATPLHAGVWYHAAMTYDGAFLKLYVNGVLDGTLAATGPITVTTHPLLFGGHADGPWSFNGLVDEVTLYNRALSAAEIVAIYNAGAAGKCSTPLCLPTPPGLVSWWRGEGSALDSWDHNKGELHGVTFAPGEVGQAFSFNGTSEYVHIPVAGNLPDAANLNVGLGAGLTLDAWVNPSDAANGHPIIEWSQPVGGAPYGVYLWVGHPSHPPGYFYANIVDTDGNWHVIDSDPGVMTANVFQHVAVTYDKTTGLARLFLNGAIIKETNLGTFTPQTSYELYFGERPPGDINSRYYLGLIDEIDVFSRALEPAEIQSIYNAGRFGKCVVNRPPVANDFRQQTFVPQPLTIHDATFTAASSDPDEDTLTLESVSATSVNGGTLVLNAGIVTYAPAAGFLGSDSFGYTVSDGNGGTASASVLVQVDPSPFAAHMLPPTIVNGGFQLNFSGYAGATYTLQRAESLAGPWVDLGSSTVDDSGNGTLLDPNPPPGSAFYRAVYH